MIEDYAEDPKPEVIEEAFLLINFEGHHKKIPFEILNKILVFI